MHNQPFKKILTFQKLTSMGKKGKKTIRRNCGDMGRCPGI